MSKTTRFWVEIVPEAGHWRVSFSLKDGGSDWRRQRLMGRLPGGQGGFFPKPPQDQLPPSSDSALALCQGDQTDDIQAVYRRIVKREPREREMRQFGSYLFYSLLGEDLWAQMSAVAGAETAIELALVWPAEAFSLHRLHWEMMFAPGHGFLAAGNPRQVIVSRLVSGTEAITAPPLHRPLKWLFAIGSPPDDAGISPGSEYLGLLRELKADGGDRLVQIRVLESTSPTLLKTTIQGFRPDVVQLVCHGEFEAGKTFLLMELDDGEQQEDLRRRSAANLLEHLRIEAGPGQVSPGYPPVVILSACYSGGAAIGIAGVHKTGPLAAQLVAGGIPIVVGMAGRISDLACRLFTRRFGAALIGGEALFPAVAQGRRAAFGRGIDPETSPDWIFPAVFAAQGVAADYVPTPFSDEDACPDIRAWITGSDVERHPVFCHRNQVLETFYQLLERPVPAVLGIGGKKHMGRTRILQEMTAQAIRGGHLPCLLAGPEAGTVPGQWEPPRSAAAFARLLLEQMIHIRLEVYGLAGPEDSATLKLFAGRHPSIDALLKRPEERDLLFWGELFQAVKSAGLELDAKLAALALQKDLFQLQRDAAAKHPFLGGPSKCVLLLDDVHRYGTFLSDLIHQKVLGPYGFGTSQNPIPVVLSFLEDGPGYSNLKPAEGRSWFKGVGLKYFTKREDYLACQHVFLHPFDRVVAIENWSNCPLTVTANLEVRKHLELAFIDLFHLELDGRPIGFLGEKIYGLASVAHQNRLLVEARDDDILRQMAGGK